MINRLLIDFWQQLIDYDYEPIKIKFFSVHLKTDREGEYLMSSSKAFLIWTVQRK